MVDGQETRLEDAGKSLADRAVDGLSFIAHSGEATGFLGPNGAGKTMRLRDAARFEPTSGTARIGGTSYADLDNPPDMVGATLGEQLPPGRSGRNHMRVYCAVAGYPDTWPTRR